MLGRGIVVVAGKAFTVTGPEMGDKLILGFPIVQQLSALFPFSDHTAAGL